VVREMEGNRVVRKNSNLVTRVIGDEMILLPIYKTNKEVNCIYTLNRVASRLWNMFDGKKNLNEIKSEILEEFSSTPDEVGGELDKILKELEEIKAITY
jgi:hypothetical protein